MEARIKDVLGCGDMVDGEKIANKIFENDCNRIRK